MPAFLAVPMSILLTALCWGVYSVVLNVGTREMNGSRLLPFICVGLAYFLIAVVGPLVWVWLYGEKGAWAATGTLWSFIAGVAGGLGALGNRSARAGKADPIQVMQLGLRASPVVHVRPTADRA